ncbi:MAG: 4Fe-4S dicluster domain-containing protein [Pseudomonadota bacterium]
METQLKELFFKTPHGGEILRCIQCGTCSASCPYADRMLHGPRELFALIRDGMMGEALGSETPWFCSSCYQCMDRCPMEIPVTDIMYSLKQMSLKLDTVPDANKMADLYKAFAANVRAFGKVTDPLVMAVYSMKHPTDAVKNLPLALRLALRKRLEALPRKTRSRTAVEKLFSPFESSEGTKENDL